MQALSPAVTAQSRGAARQRALGRRKRHRLGSAGMGRQAGKGSETVRRAQAAVAAAAGDGGEAPTVVSARPIQSLWAGKMSLLVRMKWCW